MRQALLGSTALVVFGLTAASAGAADGVKLSIGGWYHAAAGGIAGEDFSASSDVSSGEVRDYAFKQNVGVSFSGESVLDNGLTVGAYVELRGQTQEDQIRKVYAYFSGGFGKVQFGDQDGALAAMCYTVPSASKIFGADSAAVYGFNFSNAGIAGYGATNGTCYGIDSYSTQLVYFSPEFSGRLSRTSPLYGRRSGAALIWRFFGKPCITLRRAPMSGKHYGPTPGFAPASAATGCGTNCAPSSVTFAETTSSPGSFVPV
jgi:hypothetical protein